jgi:hypothetical protein
LFCSTKIAIESRLTEWLTCRLTLASQAILKITFSSKWPPLFRAEGGQVEPVLGCF